MPAENLKPLEGVIRSQLRSLGYFHIEIENENERSFSVIADGSFRSIFLFVVICLVSEHIKSLSKEEIVNVKQKAIGVEKEPWTAIMQVNEKGELVDDIQWTNLSKHTA